MVNINTLEDVKNMLGGTVAFESKSSSLKADLLASAPCDSTLVDALHDVMWHVWGSESELDYMSKIEITKQVYQHFPHYGVLMYLLETLNLSDSNLEAKTIGYVAHLLDSEGVEGIAAEYLLNVDIMEGKDRIEKCWAQLLSTPWTKIRLSRLLMPLLYLENEYRRELLSRKYFSVDLPETLLTFLVSAPNQSMKGGENRTRIEQEFKLKIGELIDYLKGTFPTLFSEHER